MRRIFLGTFAVAAAVFNIDEFGHPLLCSALEDEARSAKSSDAAALASAIYHWNVHRDTGLAGTKLVVFMRHAESQANMELKRVGGMARRACKSSTSDPNHILLCCCVPDIECLNIQMRIHISVIVECKPTCNSV